MIVGAPQPSIVHILTAFRQITNGDIRIPLFQRGFVWKNSQIIDLLDSVRAGYPIGSVLLWYVDQPILKLANASTTAFPNVPERYPTNYVLDGMQRLSSLYGVFHFGISTSDQRFNVWFDLRSMKFLHEEDLQFNQQISSIPLAALFAPRLLLQHQARIAVMDDGDALIDGLIGLQAAFQDYALPMVHIKGDDIGVIVRIFEKINSTGTSLSKLDFMRAITWARDFDLSLSVDRAKSWLGDLGYDLEEETIIKCVGMLLGVDPSSDALLNLRSMETMALTHAFGRVELSFSEVAKFFYEKFGIMSSVFVPYEGQLLVLFKAIGVDGTPNFEEQELMVCWFWAASFNESLRGKPDHYVVRAVNGWQELIRGKIRGLEPRLKINSSDFMERRLIRGKALSSAFINMFSAMDARDFSVGQIIQKSLYMIDGDPGVFQSIFDSSQLEEIGVPSGASAKVFANLILDPYYIPVKPEHMKFPERIIALANSGAWPILNSQFIDQEAVRLLNNGDRLAFLQRRANLMIEIAAELVARGKVFALPALFTNRSLF